VNVVSLQEELRARVQDALATAPFDWLVVARPENVGYVSGYRSVAWETASEPTMIAALGRNGSLYLAGPAADAAAVVQDAIVPAESYVAYGSFFFESAGGAGIANGAGGYPTLAAASRGLLDRIDRDAVLGLDGAAATSLDRDGSRQRVDASGWMLELRARKTSAELDLLAQAATITEEAIATAASAIRPGTSERAIANAVASHIGNAGGMVGMLVVTSGERSALADAHPTNRTVADGDLVRFDVGCVVDGYWSDLGRTVVVGSPTVTQRRRYEAIHAGLEAQLRAARPGISAGELFDVAVAAVEAHGLAPYRRHHCGHAIGREMYERPIISPRAEETLREGMCFCLETPFYELGWGGMIVEDMVVVTNNGARRLSHVSNKLRPPR
jgi:Xaa-Pro aminopeptidase